MSSYAPTAHERTTATMTRTAARAVPQRDIKRRRRRGAPQQLTPPQLQLVKILTQTPASKDAVGLRESQPFYL